MNLNSDHWQLLPPMYLKFLQENKISKIGETKMIKHSAFRVIMLQTATSIQQIGQLQTSLKRLWDALVTTLRTLGTAVLFTDFKTTTSVWVNFQNPMLNIIKMLMIFDKLTSNSVIISEIVKAMILIAVILHNIDQLYSYLLQMYTTTGDVPSLLYGEGVAVVVIG